MPNRAGKAAVKESKPRTRKTPAKNSTPDLDTILADATIDETTPLDGIDEFGWTDNAPPASPVTDTNTDSTATQKENKSKMTTTETRTELPDFTASIVDAPDGYSPDRSPAGRKRTPSQFEATLPELKGKGWKRIQHDGTVELDDKGKATADSVKESNAHVIKRELQKAQHFLGLGMDLNITTTDVEFRVRDLQKREKNDPEASGSVADTDDEDE